MKRIRICVLVLLLALFCCACKVKAPAAPETAEPAVGQNITAPFQLNSFITAQSDQQQYSAISINVFSDTWTRGEAPTAIIAANDEERAVIMDALGDAFIGNYTGDKTGLTVDVLIGIDQPVSICFTDTSLIVIEPNAQGDPFYYEATFDVYPEFGELREYIGELRLA